MVYLSRARQEILESMNSVYRILVSELYQGLSLLKCGPADERLLHDLSDDSALRLKVTALSELDILLMISRHVSQ